MIQLLKHLQVERGMSMIFISHDLSMVLRVADRVLVLDRGRIVEQGAGGKMLASPPARGHPLAAFRRRPRPALRRRRAHAGAPLTGATSCGPGGLFGRAPARA